MNGEKICWEQFLSVSFMVIFFFESFLALLKYDTWEEHDPVRGREKTGLNH